MATNINIVISDKACENLEKIKETLNLHNNAETIELCLKFVGEVVDKAKEVALKRVSTHL